MFLLGKNFLQLSARPLFFSSVLILLLFIAILSETNVLTDSPIDECARKQLEERQTCLAREIEERAQNGRITEAFELLAEAYAKDREFARDCHGMAHEIGADAYGHFRATGDIEISPLASYCGYGFYHGFMEKLIAEEGSAAGGKEFCERIGERLWEETSDAEGACWHGIGHSAVDGSYPAEWGDAQRMVARGLSLCEDILGQSQLGVKDFGSLYRCTTGSYNSVEILSQDSRYKLNALARDPFGFCETQKESYRPGCYTNMLPAMLRLVHNDWPEIVPAIDALEDFWGGYAMRASIVTDLAHEHIRIFLHEEDLGGASGLERCRSLAERYLLPCIEGLAGGYMKYGEPKKEYGPALAFCSSPALREDERETCFGHILPRLRNFYPAAQAETVCAIAPKEFAVRYCTFLP